MTGDDLATEVCTAAKRYRSIVDVHTILWRAGQLLLLRRAGNVYASGLFCLPSGHLEPGESVLSAAIRETREEVGVDSIALRFAMVMHHVNSEGCSRIGFFFAVQHWTGEPLICEDDKCSELRWADPRQLPADTAPYTAAAIGCVQRRVSFATDGWE